ncbi:MAG: hypothetical protein ABEL97_08150 [Salinibacter sp.]
MDFDDRYGWTDRLLHRAAFRLPLAQRTLADVEESLYRDALQAVSVEAPVFVSSLPRAGTTILLRLLWRTGRFATHTYRDMPFVLAPLLWRRISGGTAPEESARERAHGDGLTVSSRSPEAFEEMIWKHFWPDHYRDDHIRPWREGDRNSTFDAFFDTHMRKMLALHRDEDDGPRRYLSKNNLNIARLAAPPSGLQQGTFLIPFRAPVQQAASMRRQHERFQRLHEEDDFVREYMAAIGHHEFGRSLKPVNFGGWLEASPGDPDTLAFWLRYWTAAYRFVLEHAPDTAVLVSYRRLTEAPERALSALEEALGLPPDLLTTQADALRPPRTHSVDAEALPAALRHEAEAVYDDLDARAAV